MQLLNRTGGFIMPGILIALGLLAALAAICAGLLQYNWRLRVQHVAYLGKTKPQIEHSLVQNTLAANSTACEGSQCFLFPYGPSRLLHLERVLSTAEVLPCPFSPGWSGDLMEPGIQHPALCSIPMHVHADTHIHGTVQAPAVTVAGQSSILLASDGFLRAEQLVSSAQELILLSAGSLTITSLETIPTARVTLVSATGNISIETMTGSNVLTAQAAERIIVPPNVIVQPLAANSSLVLPGLMLGVSQD